MDRVLIEGLAVECIIGVYAWEREVPQRLQVDVSLAWDNRVPGASDRVEDALDYAVAAEVITQVLQEGRFALLEAAAEAMATALHQRFATPALTLTLRKPGAVAQATAVGVSIERSWRA